MSGITGILDIATQALLAEQVGVEVTGHNVANVNTPGYSRQRVEFTAAPAVNSPWGPLGAGVRVAGITRSFAPFIVARLNDKSSLLAQFQTGAATLEQVAAFFNETQAGGLNDLMNQFWAAWQDLADNPSGAGERQALLGRASLLGGAFNSRADQLVQERLVLLQEIGPTITAINSHSANIARLNQEIGETEANGHTANDLRDKRDGEVAALAQLLGVRTYTSGDGALSVTLNNGLPLVQGVLSWNLSYEMTAANKVDLKWEGPGGTVEHLPAGSLSGGSLTALIQVRDEVIPRYQEQLDELARDLIVAVNKQHSQGVGLALWSEATGSYRVDDPDAPLDSAGLPFGDLIVSGSLDIHIDRHGEPEAAGAIALDPSWSLNDVVAAINSHAVLSGYLTAAVADNTLKIVANTAGDTFGFAQDHSLFLTAIGLNTFFTGDKAYTLAVNAWVLDNPNLVATGQFDATGAHAPGDNRNALALADLPGEAVGPGGLTLGAAYQRLVMDLGLETQAATNQKIFYQGLVEQLSQLRDGVSGVSLDEELTNLVKFQRAYQAAAKLVTVADELYQTLLSLKR